MLDRSHAPKHPQPPVTNKTSLYMTQTSLSSVASEISSHGYRLQNKSIGPLLRLSLFETRDDQPFVGDISGIVFPNNRLHIESYRAKKRERRGSLFAITPGMMLFTAALAFGNERGARYVYGLAINDSPDQHRRLVRYFNRFGGAEVQRVTESLADVPARMFYGGLGTVIRGDVAQLLARGQNLLKRTKPSSNLVE